MSEEVSFCLILPYVSSISSLTFRFNCKQRLHNTFELFNPLGKQKAGFISYIIRVCFFGFFNFTDKNIQPVVTAC